MQSVSPSCLSSQNIKPALQPSLAHDAPPALSQNTTPSLCERGSLPDFVSTRLPTKRPATAAGSGEFSFFWSLNTVIASVASGLGEIMPREQIGDLPLTVKKQWSCAWLSSIAAFTYLSDNRSVYSFITTNGSPSVKRFLGIGVFKEIINRNQHNLLYCGTAAVIVPKSPSSFLSCHLRFAWWRFISRSLESALLYR